MLIIDSSDILLCVFLFIVSLNHQESKDIVCLFKSGPSFQTSLGESI